MEQIYSLIHAYFGIFRHIQMSSSKFRHKQTYSGIIQTYIQAYSEPSVILAYAEPWYIQNPGIYRYRGIFKTLVYQKPDILRTVVYSEPRDIQNPRHFQNHGILRDLTHSKPQYIQEPGIFRSRGKFRTLVYAQPCHIQNPVKYLRWSIYLRAVFILPNFHKNIFTKSAFQVLCLMKQISIMIFLNIGVIFTPKVFILCKNMQGL